MECAQVQLIRPPVAVGSDARWRARHRALGIAAHIDVDLLLVFGESVDAACERIGVDETNRLDQIFGQFKI
jgi:hypothetical protein